MAITDRRIYNKFKKLFEIENSYVVKILKDISPDDIGLIRILLSVNSEMDTYLSHAYNDEQEEYEYLKNRNTYYECFKKLIVNEVIKLK